MISLGLHCKSTLPHFPIPSLLSLVPVIYRTLCTVNGQDFFLLCESLIAMHVLYIVILVRTAGYYDFLQLFLALAAVASMCKTHHPARAIKFI